MKNPKSETVKIQLPPTKVLRPLNAFRGTILSSGGKRMIIGSRAIFRTVHR
jgi:hypothetical protein